MNFQLIGYNNAKIFFISKDANWQKYRLEILTELAETYNLKIEILTTGTLKSFIKSNDLVEYILFHSFLPLKSKFSFFPGSLIYLIINRPHAVIAINNRKHLTEYAALILCKIFRIKFIWWTHGYDHAESNKNNYKSKLKEFYTLFFLNLGDSIMTFSSKGSEYLLKKGIKGEKIFTAFNTLNTSKIIKIKDETIKNFDYIYLYNTYSIHSDEPIIIFSGRLKKEKKVEDLIRAVAIVRQQIANIKIVIVGNGEDESRLKKLAAEIAPHNIIFLGGIYDEQRLAEWFTIAKLCVIPSYVGLGIVHAFCYGLPVICEQSPNHGPELQYLKNGINGFMVEKDDVQGLALKIEELLTDEQKLVAFSDNALITAITDCKIERMISAMARAVLN